MSRGGGGSRGSIGVVWWVIFLDLLGFGMVIPSLAYYVQLFPIPPAAVALGKALGLEDTRAVFVGSIQTAYSLCQLVSAPWWGRLSDRVGRRPVLIASMAGFAVSWALFASASSLLGLLLARGLAGAFGANVATAQAYLADVFPREERARAMGLVGMAFGLGFVFGPALGAVLVSDGVLTLFFAPNSPELLRGHVVLPGLFAAALSAVALLVAIVALEESLPPERRSSVDRRDARGPLAQLFQAARAPGLGSMLFVYFAIVLGFSGLEAMFSQFNLEHLRLAQSVNAWVFTAIGLTMAAVQGGLIGPVTRRFGGPAVLSFGLVSLAVAMGAFGLQKGLNPGLPPAAWLVLLAVWTGGSFSFCNPSVLGIISNLARAEALGETMGITASAATLGRIVGPLLAGLAYAALGPAAPFLLGSVFLAVALGRFRTAPGAR
jgi:DHA1 family tetracycline resistance protein-like MFS transporter